MKLNEKFRQLLITCSVNKITVLALIIITSILLSGCAQNSLVKNRYQRSTSIVQSVKQTVVPEYKLGFGDVVEIKFFNNDQFNELVSVRPDGRITMEKIGDIFVTGMTPSKLDSLITVTYADIIINPDVTVFVRQFGGYKIYVLGEVNSPGGYALERNMTVLQALAASGGFKTTARLGNVMVLRQGKNGAVDAFKIDVTDFLNGENINLETEDLYLQPQDILYVSSTFIADVSTFLTQVYDGLLPPVDVYLRALWWSQR